MKNLSFLDFLLSEKNTIFYLITQDKIQDYPCLLFIHCSFSPSLRFGPIKPVSQIYFKFIYSLLSLFLTNYHFLTDLK